MKANVIQHRQNINSRFTYWFDVNTAMRIQSKLTDSTLLQVQQLVTYEGLHHYSYPEIWCSYLHKCGHFT